MKRRAFLLFAFAASVFAASEGERIDEILKEWSKPDAPGAAIAVIRDGKVVFSKGYGSANLEYAVPITAATVFHVASVSKQFTAMGLVKLQGQDKLSLEDDVRKYLPELPDYGHKVAIRNLLEHTAGIRDQWQTLGMAGWRLDDVITQEQLLRVLFRQKELNFTPGAEHLYSNGGYTLAAEIAARVSGKPFDEFCKDSLFDPAGMKNTHFHIDHKRVVPNRAYSYEPAKSGWQNAPLNFANSGASSLFTTAEDLVAWLNTAGLEALAKKAVLTNGKTADYGLGVSVGTHRGLRTIAHGGADAGYRSSVIWYPEAKLGIAVLSNAATCPVARLANRIGEVYLESRMAAEPAKADEPEPVKAAAQVDPAVLETYVGTYQLEVGMIIEVEHRAGKLFAGPAGQLSELTPIAANRFVSPRSRAQLEFGAGGMAVYQGDARIRATKLGGKFDAADLPSYAGAYWSDELETQYTIEVKGNGLVARHIRHGVADLRPVAKDTFAGGWWFMPELRFTRNSAGQVDGLRAGGNRVRGIQFTRK